jgi:hypothetical protein
MALSPEARRRIERLLADLDAYGTSGEPLRQGRAIEVLEHAATSEGGSVSGWPRMPRAIKAARDQETLSQGLLRQRTVLIASFGVNATARFP